MVKCHDDAYLLHDFYIFASIFMGFGNTNQGLNSNRSPFLLSLRYLKIYIFFSGVSTPPVINHHLRRSIRQLKSVFETDRQNISDCVLLCPPYLQQLSHN